MEVLGLNIVTLSLIIAVSGTVLHQIRTYNGKPMPKILDGVMVTIGGSFVAAHTALSELTPAEPFQQALLVMSLIGFTVPGAVLGQKTFSKVKQRMQQRPNSADVVTSFSEPTNQSDTTMIYTELPNPDTSNDGDKYLDVNTGDWFVKKDDQWRKLTSAISNTSKTKKKLSPPELFPKDSWYQTNFKKSDKGNSLQYGQVYLWIKIKDVRSYVTAILTDEKGRKLQVDQSHEYDEDNNIETTRLELLKADGTPFPRGRYHLTVRGDGGTGDAQGIKNDTFEIV